MCSGAGDTPCRVRGSPIRTSSDQRSVGSSPRLIAASYVLHRLLVPRHPPCALNNLTTPQHPHPPTPSADKPPKTCVSAGVQIPTRCSRPLCSSQTTTRHPPTSPTTRPTVPCSGMTDIG